MTSPTLFNAYGRYYDLLYREKDYAAETNYIEALLNRHGIAGPELLEFGSGTGKHGRLLAERGYRVKGIERSAEMVAQAVTTAGFTCQLGDICTVQLGRTFDAVLSLFHVVSYQIGNSAVQALFDRAAEHPRGDPGAGGGAFSGPGQARPADHEGHGFGVGRLFRAGGAQVLFPRAAFVQQRDPV